MPIGGSATELNITGAKLKVSGGVQVAGSIAYTDDATGFGGVTAQIDNNNTLNVTSGKLTGVANVHSDTAATITAITHTNVNNNTTIHIALKNTSTTRGVFITLRTFASDDTVKVNYTDDYMIGPGETGMLTLRKVNGVLSLFAREMFSSKATSFDATDNSPFYIKDGVNYKYPLYKYLATGLTSITINGTEYFKPSSGITTKSRPPKGIPENVTPPSASAFKIGNNSAMTTVNYDVWGVPSNFDFGSIYKGSTKKTSFLIENGQASGSFTESGASSGDAYSLYVERTDLSTSDTVSISSSGGWTGVLAFHHGTFTSSDYSSVYSDVAAAANAGRVYSDTDTTISYTWGKVNSVTTTSDNTTYTWEPPNDISNAQIVVVGGGGGGGGSYEAGGGGAGGYKSLTGQNISGGNTTIVVGKGGTGRTSTHIGNTGINSSFGSTSVLGGGIGASSSVVADPATGGPGGSGGGGTHQNITGGSGTAGQGYAGGDGITVSNNWAGGGGGGAAGVGGNASSSAAGTGGTGVTNNFLGSSIEFSAGGNGGRRPQDSNGADGTDHTGKGGGGGGSTSGTALGGSGGSGIVIIKSDDASVGKSIPKVTGISFTSSNIVFTVQQDSGTSITHVRYTINGGSEVPTAVGTLSVAHSLDASADISVVAWAVDTSGNQLSAKKTVTGTVPS